MNLPSKSEIASIYEGIHSLNIPLDLQGWGSEMPVFKDLIAETQPKVIVEVGAWKGASTIHMHNTARRLGLDPIIFSVDFWQDPLLQADGPVPKNWADDTSAYRLFLSNIAACGGSENVIPVRTWSGHAPALLKQWGITPQLVYVDAGHEDEDAYRDISGNWEILAPGGRMFGHDWPMPGVRSAVLRFSALKGLKFEIPNPEHWVLEAKP